MGRKLRGSMLFAATGCGIAAASACSQPSQDGPRPEFGVESGVDLVLERPIYEVTLYSPNVLHLTLRAGGIIDIRRGEAPQTQQVSIPDLQYMIANEVRLNSLVRLGLTIDPGVSAGEFEETLAVMRQTHVRSVINAPPPGSPDWLHMRPSSHKMSILMK